MWNASFEAQISNLCREIVESRNDLTQLQERKRELDEVVEERTIILRVKQQRPVNVTYQPQLTKALH